MHSALLYVRIAAYSSGSFQIQLTSAIKEDLYMGRDLRGIPTALLACDTKILYFVSLLNGKEEWENTEKVRMT